MRETRVLVVDYTSDGMFTEMGRIPAVLPEGTAADHVHAITTRRWVDDALRNYSHIILSPTGIPVPRNEDWFDDNCAQIREIIQEKTPLLGVCFGHQILPQVLGDLDGSARAPEAEYEIAELRVSALIINDPVLAPLAADRFVYSMHSDSVIRQKAEAVGLQVLAWTEKCEAHALRLPGHPVWGVQFHPEVSREVFAEFLPKAAAKQNRPAPAVDLINDVRNSPDHKRPDLM
ncbi:MAG: gamma-glutamyl-gamma-aminobutyrate hydrolase family protein, partial [Alphaproteobacteria bacterium]